MNVVKPLKQNKTKGLDAFDHVYVRSWTQQMEVPVLDPVGTEVKGQCLPRGQANRGLYLSLRGTQKSWVRLGVWMRS